MSGSCLRLERSLLIRRAARDRPVGTAAAGAGPNQDFLAVEYRLPDAISATVSTATRCLEEMRQ